LVVDSTPGCRLDLAPDLLQFVPGFIGTAHGIPSDSDSKVKTIKRLPVSVTGVS
jgi:hypothetical protein